MNINFSLCVPALVETKVGTWLAGKVDFYKSKKFTEHKSGEFQFSFMGFNEILRFELSLLPYGSSHAKLGFNITLLGFYLDLNVYDHRHWDYENNCWEKHD